MIKPCLKMTDSFPYQGDVAIPWPLRSGTPQEQIALESRPTSSRDILVKCEVLGCDKVIKLSAKRACWSWSTYSERPLFQLTANTLNAEACGFCDIVCVKDLWYMQGGN